MATIPLVALDIKPPEQTDFLTQFAKVQAIKSAMMQQQAGQLEMQQKRQAIADQQATTQAMLNWDGKDPDELRKAVLNNNGSGDAALGVSKHFLDIRTQTATAIKNEGEAAEARARTAKLKLDQLAGTVNGLANLPDDQLAPGILSTAGQLAQQGLIDPQHYQAAQAIAQMPPAQARQQLKLMANSYIGYTEQIDAGQKLAQTAASDATARKTEAENQFMQQYGGLTQPMADTKYRALQQQAAMGQPLSPDDQAFATAYEKQKTIGAQFTIDNRPVPSNVGTWQMAEDTQGKPILFNTKTSETKPVPAGMQKAGTYAKTQGPANDALNYATAYVADPKNFSGPGDEALMEKFFELAKPSVGFRMTQPQQDMLKNSQGWYDNADAKAHHAQYGTWFSDPQRQQIVSTMQALAKAKGVGVAPPGGMVTATGSGGGSDMVTVQIPNMAPGRIPRSAVAQFKRDHPNATVGQ